MVSFRDLVADGHAHSNQNVEVTLYPLLHAHAYVVDLLLLAFMLQVVLL